MSAYQEVCMELLTANERITAMQQEIATLTAERDQAFAQVAVLREALTKVRNIEWNLEGPANIDHAGRWYINRKVHESLMATVEGALANLPAAAARLLAADRFTANEARGWGPGIRTHAEYEAAKARAWSDYRQAQAQEPPMRPDIDHLEALANKAQPATCTSLGIELDESGLTILKVLSSNQRAGKADTDLLAEAANNLPALIAYVRELEAAKTKALDQLEQWQLVERVLKALRTP